MSDETNNAGKAQAILREIATVASDPSYPAFDGLLRQMDDTLATRGQGRGMKLYDELLRDTRCHSVIQKRATAVVAKEWFVEPGAEDAQAKAAAELVETVLKDTNFDKLCIDLLDAILKGYSVSEVFPKIENGMVMIDKTIARSQDRFVFDDKRRPRMLTRDDPLKGVMIPPRKFITHTFGGRDGNPYGLGLGSKLFWPVFFKRQGIKFWLKLADRFGTPTTVASYPKGADDAEIEKVLRALRALANDGIIAKPEEWVIDLLESSAAGNVTTQEQLCRYMDEQMAECVLGETLTTNIGSVGSKAAAETHDGIREILVKFDSDMLSETLNRSLITWIVEWNMGFNVAPPKVWRSFTEQEDLNERVDRDQKLSKMGWHLTPEKFEEIYGEGYEYRKPKPPVMKPGENPNDPDDDAEEDDDDDAAEFAEAVGDLADRLADMLDAAAMPAMNKLVAQIRGALSSSADLVDFSERILMLYPDLDDRDLARLIGDGLVAAELGGRAEIQDGLTAAEGRRRG